LILAQPSRTALLAIGGGIAAYKSAMLCSLLVQSDWKVRVIMSRAATEFIGRATLASLSNSPVAIDSFEPAFPRGAHIEIAEDVDLMIVAPSTADLMAKFANGIADDLLTTTYLQNVAPVLLAPAMSAPMWSKASVQRNVDQLKADGCHFVGPNSGWLACRVQGMGRMSEPAEIIEAIKSIV
jgi:phosphopantothenoylcysteine decarboxylase